MRIAPVLGDTVETLDDEGAPTTVPVVSGFTVYPPAPLSAEEAAAEGERLQAGMRKAAAAAWDAETAGEPTEEQRRQAEGWRRFTDEGTAEPIPAEMMRLRFAAEKAGDAASRYLQDKLYGPDGPPLIDDELAACFFLGGMYATQLAPPEARILVAPSEKAEPKKRGRPRRLPEAVPQYTYAEIAALGFAVTDVPSEARPQGKHWSEAPGGDALVHSPNRANLQVRFSLPTESGFGVTEAPNLWSALRDNGGVDTYLLAQVGAYLALRETQVTIALDDLLRLVGWTPRSAREREDMRAKVWRRLKLIDGLTIHGLRPGTYRDPDTGEVIDTSSQDALFRITGKRLPEQGSFDPEQVPLEVTWVAGPFINAHRGNPQVLTWYGDFLPIAGIPGEKPSGAWARAIGLALNQRWREKAAQAQVTRPGEANTLTVKTRPFTRRELLTLFEPSPSVAEVLNGHDPARARAYWTQAIKRLEQAGVIGYYKEAGATLPRYSWGEVWLGESLDVRPGPQWQEQAAAIAGAAKKAETKRRRTKKKP